jgi:enediyne biosynthesis protein E4
VGTKSNRMAIGAQVRVITEDGKSQWNQVSTAIGYASSSDCRVHFGLGTNRRVSEIQIRWPSGINQQIRNAEVDRVMTIEEPHR